MGERERERDTSVEHDILMFGQVEGRKKLKGEVLHLFLNFSPLLIRETVVQLSQDG